MARCYAPALWNQYNALYRTSKFMAPHIQVSEGCHAELSF